MKQAQQISSWLVRVKPPGKANSLGKSMRRRKLAFMKLFTDSESLQRCVTLAPFYR